MLIFLVDHRGIGLAPRRRSVFRGSDVPPARHSLPLPFDPPHSFPSKKTPPKNGGSFFGGSVYLADEPDIMSLAFSEINLISPSGATILREFNVDSLLAFFEESKPINLDNCKTDYISLYFGGEHEVLVKYQVVNLTANGYYYLEWDGKWYRFVFDKTYQ